jgi:hypothetical protein
VQQVNGGTVTWTGAVSTDWGNAANWSPAFVPNNANLDISIPAGASPNPSITGADITIGSLTLGTGRSLTIGAGRTLLANVLVALGTIPINGPGILELSTTGTISRSGAGGQVNTFLKKNFAGPTGPFTYPVGTNTSGTDFTPVDVTISAGSGFLTVKATEGLVPSVPPLDATRMLQRYFSLSSGGGITATVVFHYLGAATPTGDVPATSDETQYAIFRVVGGTSVTRFNPDGVNFIVNPGADTFTIANATVFSDWTVGNPLAPTAAGAAINGRVVSADGRPVYGARISMVDQNGNVRMGNSNPYGYFRFNDV